MRIGIVSDIHGNIAGLDHALAAMGSVDQVWCPGDAFNQYQFSNDVVGRLKEIGARYILGNHEEILLSPAGIRAQERDGVDQDLLEWTRERPFYWREDVDGVRLFMFHSTPWEPYGEYVYPHSRDFNRFGEVDADVAIYGHTHCQVAREMSGTLVINPGSTGLAQDPSNGRRLSFAVLDTETRAVDIENFDDPRLGG